MANYRRILEAIDHAANEWLPDGYVLGFELAHDSRLGADDAGLAGVPEDLAVVDEGSAESLARWRARLTRYAARGDMGAASDLATWPPSGRYLVVEIFHVPTGARAVRAYAYATIRDLATDDALTPAQKRTAVRNALNNLYQECQSRVQ